ncbi:MAG TPA: Gfo/Idh/MocA family oxidoreductase [Planctomycetaceae bacterium]|nr:Gfo/Idh/MocA family oxidoreductase [Planctomycetaceae bacterium]
MPHNILVIGAGSIGERHVRCFRKTGRAEISICELNSELRNQIQEKYALREAFGDLDSALANPPDAAVICTPAHLHIPMARRIAEAGISMLIEKPLSISRDGIDELAREIRERDLKLSIAYVTRVHPVLQSMREAILSNRFGKPLELIAVSGQHFPLYRPAYREIYYTRHETGGGAIQDALTHMLNASEWIVGPVTSLVCDAAHLSLEGVDVEDTVHLVTRHGAVLGIFSLNQHQAPNESTLTIVCERGTVRFEAHRTRWLSCVEPGTDWIVEFETSLERDDLFVRQADAFLDTLEGIAPAVCTLEEGLQTLKVNLAAIKSWQQRTWIDLNHD